MSVGDWVDENPFGEFTDDFDGAIVLADQTDDAEHADQTLGYINKGDFKTQHETGEKMREEMENAESCFFTGKVAQLADETLRYIHIWEIPPGLLNVGSPVGQVRPSARPSVVGPMII